MKQLVQNELIKLRAQKTYLVLSCLVLAAVIIVSFFTSVAWSPLMHMINSFAEDEDFLTASAGYQWAVQTIKKDPDSALSRVLSVVFSNPKSKGDRIREEAEQYAENGLYGYYEHYMAQGEFYDFADAHELPDWVILQCSYSLVELYRWRNIVEGLESGEYTPDDVLDYLDVVLYASFLELPYYIFYDYDYQAEERTYEFHKETDTEEGYVVCTYTEVLQALIACKPICEQQTALAEKLAVELTADAFYDTTVMELDGIILEYELRVRELRSKMEDPTQNLTDEEMAAYAYQEKSFNREIENLQKRKSAYVYLKEHDLDPDSNAYAIVDSVLTGALSVRSSAQDTLDQKELMEDAEPVLKAVYQMSVNAAKLQIEVLDQALVVLEHAYRNDLVLEGMTANSAKANFTNNLSIAAFMVTAVSIVLASMIFSREFATGTVRLWVIRPKTRSKLLLSKIATLLIYIVSMMLICFGITYAFALVNHLEDLFFFGESTMFLPRYEVLFGGMISIPAILEHLWTLVALTLPVILFAMLSFFISVLTKTGVLGIVLGMLTLMFASGIQTVIMVIGNLTGAFHYVLQLTVLPYLDMQTFLGSVIDYAIINANGGSILGLFNGEMMAGAMPYLFSSVLGAVVLIAHIALLIWASIAVFKKTQIKS